MQPLGIHRISCLMFCLCFTQFLHAQGVSVGREIRLSGFPVPNMEKSGEEWAELQRKEFETLMNLQIDMIDRDCDLSEGQIRKLRVATKGVLDRRIQVGLKRLKEFAYASQLVPLEEGQKIDNPRPDRFNDEDGPDALRIYGAKAIDQDVVLFFTKHATSITDHPMWQQILNKTLNADQLERYQNASVVRNSYLLRNAVGKWVSDLNEQLYLSESQREKITKHVNETLSAKVTPSFPDQVEKADGLVDENFRDLDETIEEVLTPKQVERWKDRRKDRVGPSVSWG